MRPLYFQFEQSEQHGGVEVEVRCKEHLPDDARIVRSEEERRKRVDSWHGTTDYSPLARCNKCPPEAA